MYRYNFLQVFMNTQSWRMAVVKDYRLMLKTVFTARPVISRTPVRTSTGYVPREGRDQHTMECEHAIWPSHSHLLLWFHKAYTCVNKSSDFLFQYRFLCVIFFLSKQEEEDEYFVPMFQKCSFSQGCCIRLQHWHEKIAF